MADDPLVMQEGDDLQVNNKVEGFKEIINKISNKGSEQRSILLTTIILGIFFAVLLFHSVLSSETEFVSIAFIQLMHFALFTVILMTEHYLTLGPDDFHTYGYARSSIVSCFAVSLTIILFAGSLLLESLKDFMQNSPGAALDVSVPTLTSIGPHAFALLIYIYITFRLRKYSSDPTKSALPHLNAAFLIGVSGIMHSLAHLIAALLPFPLLPAAVAEQAVPLFHGLYAIFVIDRARLLLVPSFFVLMQATPDRFLQIEDPQIGETTMDRMIRETSHLEGVIMCRNPHFWGLTFTEAVGSLHVLARDEANEQAIIQMTHAKFDPVVSHFTVQVEKNHWEGLIKAEAE